MFPKVSRPGKNYEIKPLGSLTFRNKLAKNIRAVRLALNDTQYLLTGCSSLMRGETQHFYRNLNLVLIR
jgi:hypothetical protein